MNEDEWFGVVRWHPLDVMAVARDKEIEKNRPPSGGRSMSATSKTGWSNLGTRCSKT